MSDRGAVIQGKDTSAKVACKTANCAKKAENENKVTSIFEIASN
jgi:hypothetical protein